MREVIFPKESGIEPCNWLADRSRSTRLSLELDNQGTIDEESWLNERSRIARDLEELTKERAEGMMIYKSAGFDRVDRVPGRPAGPIGFCRVNSQTGFCLHPDRSQARVGPVRVLKLCKRSGF